MQLVNLDFNNIPNSERFDFTNPPFDPIEFAQEIVKLVYSENALSLAGTQVDIPYKVFAMRASPENFVVYNPQIVSYSKDTIDLEETSRSMEGFKCKIKRPSAIRLRYTLPNGEVTTANYGGMTARVIQHNMDFLDGIAFYKRANDIHREKAFKDWKLFQRKYKRGELKISDLT